MDIVMRVIEIVRSVSRCLFPALVRDAVRWIIRGHLKEVPGFRDYIRVCRMSRQRGVSLPDSDAFKVRVSLLNDLTVSLRPGTSDASVFIETLVGQFHVPPPEVHPKIIWDLGANVGLTAAHYAVLFPDALIHAVEAVPQLAEIARQNTSPWIDRVEIIEAAIWPFDKELTFSMSFGNEYGGSVNNDGSGFIVQGRSLNSILPKDQIVDFLKMDIEGAEQHVLREETEWADRARVIKVECHDDYTRSDCITDLLTLGFTAAIDPAHWNCVLGQRSL